MTHYGVPGIGGSLGKCAVCGKDFVSEVLTGKNVRTFKMEAFDQTLYAHDDCMKIMEEISKSSGDWHELPDGPIKEAFTRSEQKKAQGEP